VKLAKLAHRVARGKKPRTDGEAGEPKTAPNLDAKPDTKTAGKTDGKSSKSNAVVRN
jgi:hypothetical protein